MRAAGTRGGAERPDPAGGSGTGAGVDGRMGEHSQGARRDRDSDRAGNEAKEETTAPLKRKAGFRG